MGNDYIIHDGFGVEESDDDILHYGTKRHSGRYPWGSGDNPFQHDASFLSRYDALKAAGMSDKEIAEALSDTMNKELGRNDIDFKSTYLRQKREIEKNKAARDEYARLLQLKDHGYSNTEIARKMGYSSESTVRSKLKIAESGRLDEIDTIAAVIKRNVDEKGYIDVGKGVNFEIGCNENKFNTAVTKLIEEGYERHYTKLEQLGTGKFTELMVLCPPGTDYRTFKNDISEDLTKIKSIKDYFEYDENGKLTSRAPKYPAPFSSDRLMVRYGDEGGKEKDGVIELRRGVEDISLGGKNYAQVRINVDGTHYLKGMAVYADNMPDGVDIIFNTNKKSGTPVLGDGKENSVLKKLKPDPDNPFGATVKSEELDAASQRMYKDPKTGEMKQSVINIVNSQGDWDKWSKTLSSQFLSKQPIDLAERQLNLDLAYKKDEFNDILNINNNTIKKHYLTDFAEACDKAASDLQAAAFPRQTSKVILPLTTIKDTEIYAPTYKDGEKVVLIRYPHQGTFEIPTLTVNNKSKEGKSVIGPTSQDAVGISAKTAERLSGADFDGDTVTVIPIKNVKITTTDPSKIPGLKSLVDFDPKEAYKGYEGMKVMKERTKQQQMGVISNLVTDMTLQGADLEEIARATKHAQVVIDAVKHELDYRKSYEENGIAALKERYQRQSDDKFGGAATLISRASAEVRVPERESYAKVDPKTGEKIYKDTGRIYQREVDKYVPAKVLKEKESKGEPITDSDYVYRNKKDSYEKDYFDYKTGDYVTKRVYDVKPTITITRMAKAKDANELSSGLPMEKIYANYANSLKRMANEARKIELSIKNTPVNKSAREYYSKEIESLNSKVLTAQKNAPRERQAQVLAGQRLSEILSTNPEIKDSKDKLSKAKNSSLTTARASVGASKKDVEITLNSKEWEAITSDAVGSTMLNTIINNCNKDNLREYAMPKTPNTISSVKINKVNAMAATGFTIKEIADACGISTSSVSKIINE